MDVEDLARAVREVNPRAFVQIAATIEAAVELSHRHALVLDRRIYVAGGLFLAIEYAGIAGGGRAQDLNFL
jgi:dihydrofolate synthase/folylpolyglutamate synthase